MQLRQIYLQEFTIATFQQLATKADWLCNEFAQRISLKRLFVMAYEQEPIACAGNEYGRDTTADAPRRAISMDFSHARIHHAQVTLAVNNLTCHADFAEAVKLNRARPCIRKRLNRRGLNFDHALPCPVNELAFKAHALAIHTLE
jgi:hypothetical protein